MKIRRALHACLLVLTAGVCALPARMNPAGADRTVTAPHPRVTPQENQGVESLGLEKLQQENLLQTHASSPAPLQRWSKHSGVFSAPPPEDHPESFILDLKNLPELGHADTGFQNPSIQVTIEVVEDITTETEVEMDLAKEGQRNNWSAEWININKKLFWPLFWEYPDQSENGLGGASSQEEPEDYIDNPEDSVLSQVGRGWAQYWNKGWDSKDKYEDEDWSGWAPCSASCGFGTQKRSRSCGYACTATESRTCDLESCPNDVTAVTDLAPSLMSTSTDSNVDSCEKWLSCKNDFLQRYLHQVRTQLPSCPCSYPSEAVYSAVNIPDDQLQRTYRWRDASGPKERLDIYKPSARFCLRSMLSYDSTTLAAQHCCYDDRMRLITRGKGAGSPDLISTEFSPELHYKVDVLPWILCKGDWSRFHSVRPPNNELDCEENPPESLFQMELREAREY